MSQMISRGSAAATCSTKSHCLSGNCSSSRSTTSAALTRTFCSTWPTSFGVNPFDTIERRRKCFGSSMLIIDPKNSFISWGRSPMFEPWRRAEHGGVAAHLPDVLVTGERVVAGPTRERRIGDQRLLVVDEAGRVAQLLERAVAVVARGGPELHVGEVEVGERHIGEGHVAETRDPRAIRAHQSVIGHCFVPVCVRCEMAVDWVRCCSRRKSNVLWS